MFPLTCFSLTFTLFLAPEWQETPQGAVSSPVWCCAENNTAADYMNSSTSFVLVPSLVIRWQGLRFPEGETPPPPTMSSLHNNPPWEFTRPCGHLGTAMEPHLWNMWGQWTFLGLSHEVFVIWMQSIKVQLRHFLTSFLLDIVTRIMVVKILKHDLG